MTDDQEAQIQSAAAAVVEVFSTTAIRLAETLGLPAPEVSSRMAPHVKAAIGSASGVMDGRAARWRIRVMLQRAGRDDVVADTDPDRPLDQPGGEVVHGLPSVCMAVAEVCAAFHAGKVITGLEPGTLRHALKSLRPSLSRQGGQVVWRRPYMVTVFKAAGLGDVAREEQWVARVDIRREG